MLISHKHKFITIDIPKTGSRSLRTYLQPLNILDIIGLPSATEKVPFEQHGTAASAHEQFDKFDWGWSDYYKWTVVRNPWDRYFSFFKYFMSYATKYTAKDESIVWGPAQVNQGKMCIDMFKGKTNRQVLKSIIINQPPQHEYYTDQEKNIIVDHIAVFEGLNEHFNQFCNHVGVDSHTLPHCNISEISIDPSQVYDQELIDLVFTKEQFTITDRNYKYNY